MFINNADKNGNILTVFELGVSNSDKLSEKKKKIKMVEYRVAMQLLFSYTINLLTQRCISEYI